MAYNKKTYDAQYQRDNMKQIKLTLNRHTEQDLIQHLEQQPNVRQYLIGLIRQDMTKAGD